MAARARTQKADNGTAGANPTAATEQPDYEVALARLQEVVTALEAGDLPLEKGVALYKEGLGLVRACRERLRTARNEIRLFTEDGLTDFRGVGEDADAQ